MKTIEAINFGAETANFSARAISLSLVCPTEFTVCLGATPRPDFKILMLAVIRAKFAPSPRVPCNTHAQYTVKKILHEPTTLSVSTKQFSLHFLDSQFIFSLCVHVNINFLICVERKIAQNQ